MEQRRRCRKCGSDEVGNQSSDERSIKLGNQSMNQFGDQFGDQSASSISGNQSAVGESSFQYGDLLGNGDQWGNRWDDQFGD